MKTLVFSDVHGHYEEFMLALEHARYSDQDRLIGLGDYIDYGSQSRQVLDFLVSAQTLNPACLWLRGNHENILLDAIARNSRGSFLQWEGSLMGHTTLKSYEAPPLASDDIAGYLRSVFPPEHLELLEKTVETHEENGYFYTHMPMYRGNLITIHGHEHRNKPGFGWHVISLGIEGGVAVLDLDNLMIHTDEGLEFQVDRERLNAKYGNSFKG
ncbi:MAG: metallophosphoesterase [Nitrospiraceae bacterium]|nr:metallophosphoesterase [Nitrospiraceae bacterium]